MGDATGTFKIDLTPAADPGDVSRMTFEKTFSGDLTGTSSGQMLAFRSDVEGSAGYVAMERVTGSLDGKTGSFTLMHFGTMDKGASGLDVRVVPDSGTDDLEKLSGTMTIDIIDGVHQFAFSWTCD